MCELFAFRNFALYLLLGFFFNHSIVAGNTAKTARRFKRQIVKEGRCPSWTVIKNCSSLEQCNWDGDCSSNQKCCKSTCETRSCYEPILMIGPHEDACPKDEVTEASNKKNSNCLPVRTRFCFKSNCKRCCFHYSTCNPHRELLMSKDACQKVLCSSRVCQFPGEVCMLDRYNSPRCSCRSRCPAPLPEENVCGTDGIPYKSACELNRTACILGARDIKIQSYGNCHSNGVKMRVSAAHKRKQILPAYKQGELTCRFEGDPVSITWRKVGLRTLPNRMVPRMDKLDILDVDMRDSGMYKCVAYDGFSTAEAEINVTVNEPPSSGRNIMPLSDCIKPRSTGYCKRYTVRWYFDRQNGVCRPFVYGGCGGNKNNFPSEDTCSSACGHSAGNICYLPMIEGPCRGFILQWFYNLNTSRCEQFVYGGCGGNANRFNTKAKCQQRCAAEPSVNSPCLRQQLEARRNKHLGVFVPKCRPDGGYEELQCHGAVCFCIDEDGKKIDGTRVPRHQPLNCSIALRKPAEGGLTPCQMSQQNSTGLPFGNSHLIRCKEDGSYEEVQCSGSTGFCWCVNQNGSKLDGTETRGILKCPALGARLTPCQRQYLEHSRSPQPHQEIPRCQENGNFEKIQCQGTMCFCVDPEDGRIVKDTSVNALFGEPRCGDTGHGITFCQRIHQEALTNPSKEIYVPQCNRDGSFVEVQCHGPSNECWCVDKQGRELTGTRRTGPLKCVGLGQPMTACQKEYQTNLQSLQQSLNRYVPRCAADGSYEQVQCAGGVCYCVTPQGKQIPGSSTYNSARQPNCTHPDANITPCEKKRRESIFYSKKFVPFCKPDGRWSEIQCERSSRECWCVDSSGKEIPSTRSSNLEKCPDFDCFKFSAKLSPCRKRLLNLLKSAHPVRHLPWCQVDGSYNPMQCYGSYCYCVYENGNEQPGTKISVVVGRPVCIYTSGTVTDCQRRYHEASLQSSEGVFVPRCKSDGRFEEVQCQGSSGECWCVDQNGKEILGTRTTQPVKCPISGPRLTTCQKRYIEYAKNPLPGMMIPRCREDGTFEPMQCQGLDCFCVDNDGNEIKGTSLPARLGKPKCGISGNEPPSICQKQYKGALQLPATPLNFIPTCKRDGRFEEIQCLRATGECWCVDQSGKETNGTRTTGYLICPSAGSPLKQCQKEYQGILRSWILPGPYIPQCTHDGRYEPIQCRGLYCFCVNDYGVEFHGTRLDIIEGKPKCRTDGGFSLTLCQRQFQDYLRHPMPGRFEPRCSKTGAYQAVQCHGDVCFCVNFEGTELPGTRQSIAMGKPICPSPGNVLTSCQKQLQEAINLPPEPTRFVPHCKLNGDYEGIQCENSSGLCWCVDKDGRKLSYTVTSQAVQCSAIETNSLCWTRYQQNIKSGTAGSHVPWCTSDGSFSQLQIQGSLYFCIYERGDEVAGTSVDISLGLPDCHAATSRGYIVTPCQRERARRSHLPLAAGKYVPRCKVDGTYDEVQCDVVVGQCWCVDREGKEIKGTRNEGVIRCPSKDDLTPCQKHQERAKEFSASGPNPWNFIPRCREDGGYYEVQCHVGTGQCWCVDENGNERWGTTVRGLPDCSANITSCQRHRTRALGLAGSPPPGTYVPHCNPDGSYGDVQCHSFTGLCWCVDEKGKEILGTRKWGRPRCSRILSDQETPIDLGILIDASDASVATNWTRLLSFVSSIVASFDISSSGTHVGLIVFSRNADVQLYFNTLQENNLTIENVKRAVSILRPKGGFSRFDLAMLLAEEELFNEATGMRNEIPKTLLLVTTSSQARNQGPYSPLTASAQGLRDRGVFIYAVGIGDEIKVPELLDLTSDYMNVFTSDNFGVLQSSSRILTEIIKNKTNVVVTKEKLCNMPSEPGQLGCLASISVFYFEAASGECHSFVYSGCGGNANNFPSYEKCMGNCKGVLPSCIGDKKRVSSLRVGHFTPKCKTNGRYEDVQCYGKTGYCWCVDEFGKDVPGTRVMGIPICSLATAFGKLTPCLEERRKALGMDGVPSVGRFAPECNPDGEYAKIQCFGNSNFCWCSDKRGYEIPGTHRWGTPECPIEVRPGVCPFITDPTKCPAQMTQQTCSQDSDCPDSSKCCDCGCVRRCTFVSTDVSAPVSNCVSEHLKSLSSSCPHFKATGRFFPKCKPDGGYEELQCNELYGVCWCVDKDGNEIPGSRQIGKPNCTKQVVMTPCERERKRAMGMRSRSPIGLFVVSCQTDGSFNPTQCHNATGYCWCVDKQGNELKGTRKWGKPNCTDKGKALTVCQSRHDECLDNAPPGHSIPRCKADGSYEERQCLQLTRECWCVDKNGNELPGTRSREMHDCSLLAWLSPCQIKKRQALGLRGVPVVGPDAPECKADGGYDEVQCHVTSEYCWCVDEYGNEVQESRIKGRPSCEKEPPCKKESETILASFPKPPPGMFVPQCRKNGGYEATQCDSSTGFCWCVDEYGNELMDTRVKGHVNCSALTDQKLSLCHSRYNKATEVNEQGHHAPLCEPDGSYKQIQCNSATGECWCVDREGREKLETRRVGIPHCQSKLFPKEEKSCELPPDTGPCKAYMPLWYFNTTTRTCAVFIYGGCDGNGNRFPSYYDCQDSCSGRNLTFCELQREIDSARSRDFIPRCKEDGRFEEVQCQRKSEECWCVDEAGMEIPESRTIGLPKCDKPDAEGIGSRGAR